MLKHLYIKSYALISELDLDLNNGFTVITGETGAGKSILLGALNLVLGGRADTKAISEGHRDDWTAIAIAGRGEDYCWPCGACRQMLYEFAPELRVLAARGDGSFQTVPLSRLLPHGFGPKSLV